jgi:hypothetical protein
MEFLSELWIPILVSAAFVWVASFLVHMVLPFHKKDWKRLPDEGKVSDALTGVPAGNYMFPYGTMADMKDPAFIEKQKRGPNGTITLWPGMVNMGQNLVLTLLSYILIGIFVAYIAWHAFLGESPEYLDVFRITGAGAFMANGLGMIPWTIWYRSINLPVCLVDALIYALVTAGTFGWLWPAAEAVM